MSNANTMYALGLDQLETLIALNGHKRTVLVQGHMGTGKSSLLRALAKRLPNHTACYFDCTTKDLGDITIPQLQTIDAQGFVRYVTNEELGMHLNKPIVLMIDEYGKANPAVKNALLRTMLEREMGSYTLHPDSIIFATTNLGAEGVGDVLPPHARNRVTVITSRKPTSTEWIEWGINNGIEHILLGACKEFPQWFQSFDEVASPDDNPYIFHPKAQRTAFVTPRSLEAASDWLKLRTQMDDQSMTAALIGTIGDRAAMDLMAFVKLADQLPSLDSIKRDPLGAKVPTSDAAVCMIVYRTLSTIDRDWIDAWMDYMVRLDKEAQGMFANGVRTNKYDSKRQAAVMLSAKFRNWAMANNYMFAADVK